MFVLVEVQGATVIVVRTARQIIPGKKYGTTLELFLYKSQGNVARNDKDTNTSRYASSKFNRIRKKINFTYSSIASTLLNVIFNFCVVKCQMSDTFISIDHDFLFKLFKTFKVTLR